MNAPRGPYQDRDHFLNVAASAMRRILIDRARRMSAERRGGGDIATPLDGELDVAFGADPDLLIAVDEAMACAIRPEQVKLVELRFFAGYTMEERAADGRQARRVEEAVAGDQARSVRTTVLSRALIHRHACREHP